MLTPKGTEVPTRGRGMSPKVTALQGHGGPGRGMTPLFLQSVYRTCPNIVDVKHDLLFGNVMYD